jgi:hypothetical protein
MLCFVNKISGNSGVHGGYLGIISREELSD